VPTKFEYTVFESCGFKVNHTTFQLVPLSDEYAHDEPVYMDEIAPWDLYDILDVMTKEERLKWLDLELEMQQQKKGGKSNA
jgi:hypothetical protein